MRGLIFLSVVVLAGCATSGPTWYKTGATQASFNADKNECQYEAVKHAGNYGTSIGQAYAAAMHRNDIVIACLRNKGYSTQEPLNVTPSPLSPVEVDGFTPIDVKSDQGISG